MIYRFVLNMRVSLCDDRYKSLECEVKPPEPETSSR